LWTVIAGGRLRADRQQRDACSRQRKGQAAFLGQPLGEPVEEGVSGRPRALKVTNGSALYAGETESARHDEPRK
jgi:hypothetical protein